MITTCAGCHARYRLDASKVPQRMIHVRCPECGTVFDLDGARRESPAPVAPVFEPRLTGLEGAGAAFADDSAGWTSPAPTESLDLEPSMPAPTPAPEPTPLQRTVERAAPAPAGATVDMDAVSSTAVADPPRTTRRRRRDKSEMLARALVSDILVYNREARDKALSDGNLLKALGPEIKKSWELYKEKVGAKAASESSYFKDALNDILADGQTLF